MQKPKIALLFVITLYLGMVSGQSFGGSDNIYGFDGVEFEFQGSELNVSEEHRGEDSFRITRDYELFIGEIKVQLSLSQKGLVGQFYNAANELYSIADDIGIHGVDIDADAVAELADDIVYNIQPVLADLEIPEIDVSTDDGHLSVEVDLEGIQAMVAGVAHEIEYITENLVELVPGADAFGEISETVRYLGDLAEELKSVRQSMRRSIPELRSLSWF